MTPENLADFNQREKEFLQKGVLILYPLALSSLVVFDLRTSPESKPKAMLLAKRDILSEELIDQVTGHFQVSDEPLDGSVANGISLPVLQELIQDRPEIASANVVLHFCRSPLAISLEESWKKIAPMIFSKIDKGVIAAMFKELEQEEKSNYQRSLITGNRLAGIGTLWQRGENGSGLFRLPWFFN